MPLPSHIVGHRLVLEELSTDLETGNVVHAYLFTGPRHLGKFTVVKWFAKELLRSSARDAEDDRRICDQADRLLHPDLFVLDQLWIEGICEDFEVISRSSNVPQQHRKEAKAKTDEISIEDIRVLHERLYEVGTGQYRCCLIHRAERMTEAAANALLKMLEEPPAGMVFLLTSESPSVLLPTVVSRARVLRLSRVGRQELLPLLEGVLEDDAHFILRLAQGAPGIVCTLRDDPEALRVQRLTYAKALSFWESNSLMERLQLLTPLHARTQEAQEFLLHLALALRERKPENFQLPATALLSLTSGLRTNAQRRLLTQQFALAVSDSHP